MASLWFLLALYAGCGLLFIAIAIPLVQRRVPPNRWYGFRVERTMNNSDIWYPANAYSGRLLIAAGAGVIAVAVIAALFLAQHQPPNTGLFVAICTAMLLGGLLISAALSFRYLRSLP